MNILCMCDMIWFYHDLNVLLTSKYVKNLETVQFLFSFTFAFKYFSTETWKSLR